MSTTRVRARWALALAVSAVAACQARAPGPDHSTAARPGILFIAAADLRPELGVYGRSAIHSPNIDRLARAGLLFERACVQQAVCSPSRTSLLTGLRPDATRVRNLQTTSATTSPTW